MITKLKTNLEDVDNASVSKVRSTISRVKKQLMQKWAKKGGYENFGQEELRNLKDKFKENPYGSPEERQISDMLSAFNKWAMNYSGELKQKELQAKSDKIMKRIKEDMKEFELYNSVSNENEKM